MNQIQKPWRTAALADVPASELRERMAGGRARPSDVVDAHLHRIREREPEVSAFAFFDENLVAAQAKVADLRHGSGRAPGDLNGIPVAVKDIIDTVKEVAFQTNLLALNAAV